MSKVQAVIFKKQFWNCERARIWLKKHDFQTIKRVDITKNFLRYRIEDPKIFESFRTKKITKTISFIIGR